MDMALRLEGDQRAVAPQLAPRRIPREIFKGDEQCTAPLISEESIPIRALTSLTSRTVPVKLVTCPRKKPLVAIARRPPLVPRLIDRKISFVL
jgi:hypothetical protein